MKSTKTKHGLGRSACQDRSEKTRHRLIEVAVEVFADLGYEAASTRTIVERAQTNLVSIPYYFGSKMGLYNAVAEYIGTNVSEMFRPEVERARKRLKDSQSREQTLEGFLEFVIEFARFMLGERNPAWGKFVYREQFDPTEAFDIIHLKFVPMIALGCEYVSSLTGRPANAPETRIKLLAILAMVKLTRVDRASVLRTMEWKTFGPEETRIVTDVLTDNVRSLFARSE
jgi:AcrR family transcriptional regulator